MSLKYKIDINGITWLMQGILTWGPVASYLGLLETWVKKFWLGGLVMGFGVRTEFESLLCHVHSCVKANKWGNRSEPHFPLCKSEILIFLL